MNKDETVRISKALSYVLRHNPASIGINIDDNGWASINELLLKLKINSGSITLADLKYVVENNNKQRFSFNQDGTKIRASQGHSIKIDLNYSEAMPPAILFHGTSQKSLLAILEKGLQKMNRHHVHLSADVPTAADVGRRHGNPVILKVYAGKMYKEGYEFYQSDNKVWLTEVVPVRFIEVLV